MIDFTQYNDYDLQCMYDEVVKLREGIIEYTKLFGYEDVRCIAKKDIEHDIEKEVGRRQLTEKENEK
jgi:hypothetical protein